MNRLRRWSKIVVVCALVCTILGSCDDSKENVPKANKLLSAIKFPTLPNGVTTAHSWSGGTFAKYVNIKFTATPQQAKTYLKDCGLTYYYEIDLTGNKATLAGTHSLVSTNEISSEFAVEWASNFNSMVTEPWFEDVCQIQHAWFGLVQETPLNYRLWYDLDKEQFYIYWTYS